MSSENDHKKEIILAASASVAAAGAIAALLARRRGKQIEARRNRPPNLSILEDPHLSEPDQLQLNQTLAIIIGQEYPNRTTIMDQLEVNKGKATKLVGHLKDNSLVVSVEASQKSDPPTPRHFAPTEGLIIALVEGELEEHPMLRDAIKEELSDNS